MTYSELENFTWDDLSNFTCADLSLDKYELMAKAENGSLILPDDVQSKLRALCTELSEKVPEKKSLFSNISLKTVGDATKILVSLLQAAKLADDVNITMRIKQVYDFIASILR